MTDTIRAQTSGNALGQELADMLFIPVHPIKSLFEKSTALINQGADLTVRGPLGMSVFQLAAENRYNSVLGMMATRLIAQKNVLTEEARTLLDSAVSHADSEGQKILKSAIRAIPKIRTLPPPQ